MEKSTHEKRLFLALSVFSLFLLMGFTSSLWFIIEPHLWEYPPAIPLLLVTVLRIFFLVILIGLLLLLVTAIWEANLVTSSPLAHLTLRFLYPINVWAARLLNIEKDAVRRSFVFVNNAMMHTIPLKVRPEKLLLLLPHCLQRIDCPYRITADINHCVRCNRCVIGKLLELQDRYGFHTAIATGGTLARKVVRELRPKVIVAVACERDLTSGIQDTYPIVTVGVLNERPEGPCVNTTVDVDAVEKAIQRFLK